MERKGKKKEKNTEPKEPYTMSVKCAELYFGFGRNVIHNMVNSGKLIRGVHYLKIGVKTLIVREKFIEWMRDTDRIAA